MASKTTTPAGEVSISASGQRGPAPRRGECGLGDRGGCLRCEQQQGLFVLPRELLAALLVAEKEGFRRACPGGASAFPAGSSARRSEEKAERTDVGAHIVQSQWRRQIPEVLEEPRPVGPLGKLAVLLGSQTGGDELAVLPTGVDGRDRAVAGAGQRAGTLDDLLQDGVQVEACADAQNGRAQPGDTFPQAPRSLAAVHRDSSRQPPLPFRTTQRRPARAAVRLPPNAKDSIPSLHSIRGSHASFICQTQNATSMSC